MKSFYGTVELDTPFFGSDKCQVNVKMLIVDSNISTTVLFIFPPIYSDMNIHIQDKDLKATLALSYLKNM